jgi:RNA polymerase sigma factor (sigma-70 family)
MTAWAPPYYHRAAPFFMSPPDPLFEAYIRAGDADAPSTLERIVDAATPAIRDVCASTLGFDHHETEDACADALMRVIARVQQLRETNDEEAAIQNLVAYAAVTARRVCADYLRRAHPVRARLGSRVRYALIHDPALRLRRTEAGVTYAGLADWRDTLPAVSPSTAVEIAARMQPSVTGPALLETIRTLLDRARGWIETGALISALFDGAALRDPVFMPADDIELAAPSSEDPGDAGEARARLEAAWREISILPIRQRIALLFHLRDETGASGLAVLVLSGVVTLDGLASALELATAELAELWASIPLDDLRIAKRLNITRQQVINLRKSARARLGRRLAGNPPALVIPGPFDRQTMREHS